MTDTSAPGHWNQDPREILKVTPGFSLADLDRHGKPGFKGKKKHARALMASRGRLLSQLQERLFAEGRAGSNRSVLCVVQGLDTAGKGGVARHVMGMVDPQGVQLRSFGVPTEEERKHHYLWRIKKALPTPGHIGVFDRSHYEDVLVVRVNELVPKKEWEKRYDEINAFEKELVDSGITLLKFALMVSHDEQGIRLMERLDRPDKRWKFSKNDLATRAKWGDYQDAYQAVFDKTSTDYAPWYVLPCDRKWYSRAAIVEILTHTMIEMQPTWPKPDWEPDELRTQLAEMMSANALQTSLEGTEATVRDALDEDNATERTSLQVEAAAGDLTAQQRLENLADISEVSAEWLNDLTATRAQKKELVEKARLREGLPG